MNKNYKFLLTVSLILSIVVFSCSKDNEVKEGFNHSSEAYSHINLLSLIKPPQDTCKAKFSINSLVLNVSIASKLRQNRIFDRPIFMIYTSVGPQNNDPNIVGHVLVPAMMEGDEEIINGASLVVRPVNAHNAIPSYYLWYQVHELGVDGNTYSLRNFADSRYAITSTETDSSLAIVTQVQANGWTHVDQNWNLITEEWVDSNNMLSVVSAGSIRSTLNNRIMSVENIDNEYHVVTRIEYNPSEHNPDNLSGGFCDIDTASRFMISNIPY